MKSAFKQLAAASLAIVFVLGAYYVTATPLPIAIYHATNSAAPGWHRNLFRLRSRVVLSCPQRSDFSPSTPLIYLLSTMESESVDVVEAKAIFGEYLQRGCDINAISEGGLRPIHAAILSRNSDSLQFVLDMGADPNQSTGPASSFRYTSGSLAKLDASAFLAKLCAKEDTNCEELRAVLVTAKRAR